MMEVAEHRTSNIEHRTLNAGPSRPARDGTPNQEANIPWTAHPIVDVLIPPLTTEEIKRWLGRPKGFEAVMGYWERHEAAIRESNEDPLRRGFELPFWGKLRALFKRKTEVYALGGNGPGKTELGGKLVGETLCEQAGRKVLCVATNENSSKQLQQPAVYKYLPVGMRSRNEMPGTQKRERVTKVKYTPAGGFTEGTFVLPNRSQCWFKTVRQYLDDKNSFEGPEYDLVWIDEPAPVQLVHTLSYRVAKRRGKFLFTFTAIHGFDAVCNSVLTGARMVETLPMNYQWRLKGKGEDENEDEDEEGKEGEADGRIVIPELKLTEEQVKGCPPGHMPFVMQPLNPAQGVIFLWTHWNLFLPRYREDPQDARTENPHWPELFKTLRGKSQQAVRTRLFGWAEKIAGTPFPQFNQNVHVVPLDRLPARGTDYSSGDPATARSYFLLWARVDELGRKFIFDESPRYSEGEWVTAEGERGDGQRIYAGRGVDWYKGHIRRREEEHGETSNIEHRTSNIEQGRTPIRRFGDPRAFATEAASREGGQSLFDLFLNDGGEALSAPMYWEPAKVRERIYLELEKINDELAYDERKPISRENEPQLYITENCQNLIRSLLNYNMEDGPDSPFKDPIDTLRYLFAEPLNYVDPGVPEIVGGRGW